MHAIIAYRARLAKHSNLYLVGLLRCGRSVHVESRQHSDEDHTCHRAWPTERSAFMVRFEVSAIIRGRSNEESRTGYIHLAAIRQWTPESLLASQFRAAQKASFPNVARGSHSRSIRAGCLRLMLNPVDTTMEPPSSQVRMN